MTKLDDAYKRLTDGLTWLKDQPGSTAHLAEIRDNATTYLNNAADTIAGKTRKCDRHPTERAHNCGPCRSEKIAVRDCPELARIAVINQTTPTEDPEEAS